MDALYGKKFNDLNELKRALKSASHDLGFAVVVHKSYPNAKYPSRIMLRCCKGRLYKSQHNVDAHPSKSRLSTSSQMTGCPFRLTIAVRDGFYTLCKARTSEITSHNHELDASSLVQVRQEKVMLLQEKIISLCTSGVPPSQIFDKLRQECPDKIEGVKRHDIYNSVRRHLMWEEFRESRP